MEEWTVTLGNTLLASIVCLAWYALAFWDEAKDEQATSVKNEVKIAEEEEEVSTGVVGGGHLYMSGASPLLLHHQSTMQLPQERLQEETKGLEEPKKGQPKGESLERGGTFLWPQRAGVLEAVRTNSSIVISEKLEDKLKDLGIYRTREEEVLEEEVDGAARRCGLGLTRKQVHVSFDTFMAKVRPGLSSGDEEAKESPKPKKNKNKKMPKCQNEEPKSWHEDRENRSMRTGWSNPAWKATIIKPESGASLVRAF